MCVISLAARAPPDMHAITIATRDGHNVLCVCACVRVE